MKHSSTPVMIPLSVITNLVGSSLLNVILVRFSLFDMARVYVLSCMLHLKAQEPRKFTGESGIKYIEEQRK